MATYKIAVLGGDGIGQEVTPEAQKVLKVVGKATGASFEFEPALVGGVAIDATGGPLPDSTLRLCQQSHAILFGSVGGPKWDNLPQEQRPERGLLGLRKELDLFANLRPATCFPDARRRLAAQALGGGGHGPHGDPGAHGRALLRRAAGAREAPPTAASARSIRWSTRRGRSSGWRGPRSTSR